MKHLNSFIALAMFSFFLVSCTQDSETVDAGLDLTAEMSTSIKTQKANATFDNSKEGIYHGTFTSGTAQSNGKVWVNLGNDTKYSAIVELTNGTAYNFELVNSSDRESNTTSYKFVNENGSFIIDVSNHEFPLLKEASLNDVVHLSTMFKHTSQNRTLVVNGTFAGDKAGTWNLSYDETGSVPLTPDSFPLEMVEVFYMGSMFTDAVFETMAVPDCTWGGSQVYYGNPNAFGGADPKDMCVNEQTSDFAGMTTWSLHHSSTFGGYITCPGGVIVASGTWSRDGGATTGTILID